ncbi:MAG: dephospho-CoA kinase [Betaproteobacteria bacterium]|nr:dephospho-CoA kinase [Betaproteobacteria bacterium]
MSCTVIGLTGGIASGKSLVSDLFAKLGVPIVDTDKIAHTLTQTGGLAIPAIRAEFGPDSLDAQGALNRSRMRELVFNDITAKTRLEAILHPAIFQLAIQQLAAPLPECAYQILVVPLLLESGNYLSFIDRILVVDCSEAQQIQRAISRGQLDEKMVKKIIAQQTSQAQRLAMADDVIDNHNDIHALHTQVLSLHQHYQRLHRIPTLQ